MSGHAKPLLLLDVDGPLNPWKQVGKRGRRGGGGRRILPGYTAHDLRGVIGFPDGLQVILNPAHNDALRALSETFTLIWATAWQEEANEFIGPLLGLRHLPVIEWPAHVVEDQRREGRNGSWKTPWVSRWLAYYAPGIPWAWVDDEVNRYDRFWFAQHHYGGDPGPHLIHRVEEGRGLVDDDFVLIRDWAASLPE